MKSEAAEDTPFDPVAVLRDPETVRIRAHRLLDLGIHGDLTHFAVHPGRLEAVADLVAETVHNNHPGPDAPYHGRWRHFAAGGYDRWSLLQKDIHDRGELVRSAIDLAVISVLLGAAAGPRWVYHEDETGVALGRSEGLAVASFYMFKAGFFSSDPSRPLQVDATALARLSENRLASGFQADADNPLQGLESRMGLLRNLAKALSLREDLFGSRSPFPARPGNMYDYLSKGGGDIRAQGILAVLLDGFSGICPGRVMLGGKPLGDVWTHARLTYNDPTDLLMPFHKLWQGLAVSLVEPFSWAGLRVTGIDRLTGLADYRNGGLFVDMEVLELKDPLQAATPHRPSDELIVEWRALTVALLDRLRAPVAERLGARGDPLMLPRMLEAGTWAAGRRLAAEKRPGAEPPVRVISDGTVF